MSGSEDQLKFTHDEKGLKILTPIVKPATADIGIALRARLS
jgi:hypothetical protein